MVEKILWGGSNDLMQKKNEEGYVMNEVRPEGCIDGLCSYITLIDGICEVSSDIQRYM